MKKSWKRVAAGALSLTMAVGMMPSNVGSFWTRGKVLTASATQGSEPTTLTDETTTWATGDYIVPETVEGVGIYDHVTVNGTVNLTLQTGRTLRLNNGITLSEGATLNISGGGVLRVYGSAYNDDSTTSGSGTLFLTSGSLIVAGGSGEDIGSGEVDSVGENGGAAINGNVIVNDGELLVVGGYGGDVGSSVACIGGNGGVAINGDLTVNGGAMSAIRGLIGSIDEMSDDCTPGSGANAYSGKLTLGAGVNLYEGTDFNGTLLDGNNSSSREYTDEIKSQMHADNAIVINVGTPVVLKAGDKFGLKSDSDSIFINGQPLEDAQIFSGLSYAVYAADNGLYIIDPFSNEIPLPDFAANSAKTYVVELTSDGKLSCTENKIYNSGTVNVSDLKVGDVVAPGVNVVADTTYWESNDGNKIGISGNNVTLSITSTGVKIGNRVINFDTANGKNAYVYMGKDNNGYDCFDQTIAPIAGVVSAPTAVDNLKYTNEAKALINAGTASDGATMKYAMVPDGKKLVEDVITCANETTVEANKIKVGNVLTVSGRAYFPPTYTIKYRGNEYTDSTLGVRFAGSNGIYYYLTHPEGNIPFGTDEPYGLLITDITGNVITVESVKIADAVKKSEVDTVLTWADSIPQKTNAGSYDVYYKAVESGKMDSAIGKVTATIAKGNLIAGTDFTAPTAKEVLFDDTEQELITKGTIDSAKGTLKYHLYNKDSDTLYPVYGKDTDFSNVTLAVGDMFKFDGSYDLPSTITQVYLDNKSPITKDDSEPIELATGSHGWLYINGSSLVDVKSGCDAVVITEINGTTLKLKSVKSSEYCLLKDVNVAWSNDAPKGKETGDYDVYYKIIGGSNYNDYAATKLGTVKIDYSPTSLTVSNLGDMVIIDSESKVLTATNDVYTLKGAQTYTLYSDKTVAGADENGSIVHTVGMNQTYNNKPYKYKYNLVIPAIPDEGYAISHNNNWSSKVFNADKTKLYVADGVVPTSAANGILAATLKGDSTYYYGDKPDKSNVDIVDAFKNIVKVDSIYLADSTGAKIENLSTVKYGKYTLTAKMLIDGDGDGDFTTGTDNQSYQTLEKTVTYAPRPMNMNEFYLGEEKDENKLTLKTVYDKYKQENGKPTDVPADDANIIGYELIIPDGNYTYNNNDAVPVIIIKNGGNKSAVALTTDYTTTASTTEGTYKNAGSYSYDINAVAGDNANYTGKITVKWNIAKSDINNYITVVQKSGTVYDGKVLDGTDFEVKKTAAYNDADDAAKALVDQFIAELNTTPAKTTIEVSGAKYTKEGNPPTLATYDIKSAGNQKANVVVKNSNFKEIKFDQTVNNGNITKDNSIAVTIAKRDVKAVPAKNQYMTFRDKNVLNGNGGIIKSAIPSLVFDADGIEKAELDAATGNYKTNTGLVGNDTLAANTLTIANYDLNGVDTIFKDQVDSYGYYINNAGKYEYTVDATKNPNYNITLIGTLEDESDDEDADPTPVPKFEVKRLNINNAGLTFTLKGVTAGNTSSASVSYNYDGNTKEVDIDSIVKKSSSGNGNDYALVKGTDFIVGGANKRAGTGEYQVQVMGKGNYSGVYKGNELKWSINALNYNDYASLKIEDCDPITINGEVQTPITAKEYDGAELNAEVVFKEDTDGAKAYKKAADVKITYKDGNKELEDAPVDVGSYDIIVEIKADGYPTQNFTVNASIDKRTVTKDMTKTVGYGTQAKLDNKTLTEKDLNKFEKILPEDRAILKNAVIKSKYSESATGQKTLEYVLDLDATEKNVGVEAASKIKKVYDHYNWTFSVTINPKSISNDDIVVTIDGVAILSNKDFAIPGGTLAVYDKAFADNDNPNGKLLVKGTDYIVNDSTTGDVGTYTIEIVGKGNYKGTKAVEYNAISAEEAAKKATKFTTKVDIAENPKKPGVKYVKYYFTRSIAEDAEISAAGYVYIKDTVDKLTIDTKGARIKTVETTNKNGTVGIAVPDEGKGTTAVGFVVVNGEYIYSDVISKTYKEVIAEKASVNVASIATAKNPNKPDVKYVKYTFGRSIADDVEISAVGYVYVKDTVDELTIDTEGAKFKIVETTNKNGTVGIAVPDDGKGTTAVGFVVVNGEYIYSDVASRTYEQVASLR
jgi:hypothetical protein